MIVLTCAAADGFVCGGAFMSEANPVEKPHKKTKKGIDLKPTSVCIICVGEFPVRTIAVRRMHPDETAGKSNAAII